ncbi:hypothetical protein [Eleftheria terrae]|nr:hypothetical protein [Eleftheria terrae]WKB54820.1 hypothetical protein N7L95_10740 [Eleftheria terrae]
MFQPQADGSWAFTETSGHGMLALQSVRCELPLAWIFNGMDSGEA